MFYPTINPPNEKIVTNPADQAAVLICVVPAEYVHKNGRCSDYSNMDFYGDLYKLNTDTTDGNVLLNELSGIDITTLPTCVEQVQFIQAIHMASSETVVGWEKSKSLIRYSKKIRGIGFICNKVDRSWIKLLVACIIKARRHPKVDKMSVFNINYGKPTELGVEIIISACEMITGGEGALRSWILANFDFDNPNQNIDALCETLSEIYDIPLKIMEGFVVAICCQEWESRGKEWIIPRLAKYINLTGRKYTGLYESRIKL